MPFLLFAAGDSPPWCFAIYDHDFNFGRGSFAGESRCALRYKRGLMGDSASGVTLPPKISGSPGLISDQQSHSRSPSKTPYIDIYIRDQSPRDAHTHRERANTTDDHVRFWSHFHCTRFRWPSWKMLLCLNKDIHISHLLLPPAGLSANQHIHQLIFLTS